MALPFKLRRIDHLGIVARDPSLACKFFGETLGLKAMGSEEVASEKTRTTVFSLFPEQPSLEILEPLSEDSPIQRYIAKYKGGIHHLAFEVDDLRQAIAYLKEHSIRLLSEQPKLGHGGCLIVFIHPASTGGILVELIQSPD